MGYTATELMICCASRILEDQKTIAVGTGIPVAAGMLAQKLHAPHLTIMFEAGGIAPELPTMPISVGDSRTYYRAIMAASMNEVMNFAQKGMIDFTFLSGAQIDMYGNLNSTMIGDNYHRPKVRLPGSGGANDLASLCWKTIIIMKHDHKKWVEKVDFLTSPGYLTGPGAREKAGLPANTGPFRVICDFGVWGFHPETKKIQLISLHPGVTLEQVQKETQFPIEMMTELTHTEEPTPEELHLLRTEVDPQGYILRRG